MTDTVRVPPAPPVTAPPPEPVPAARSRPATFRRAQRRTGVLMVAPAVLHMIWWIGLPLVGTVVLAFAHYDVLANRIHWAGLANFQTLWHDHDWNYSILHTIVYTFFTVPVTMAIALVLAVLVNQKLRARLWYRTAFFLPQVTATVAIAMVWLWMYEPRYGLINAALDKVGVNGPAWLSDPTWAMPAVILVGIWKGIGVKMLIYLAALQNVPPTLYEAARIDGASAWRQFRAVTLPLLKPATFFVFVVSVIDAMQVFDQVYVLTPGGGPAKSTNVMTNEIYETAFEKFDLSLACAQSLILFVFLFVLTAIGRRFTRSVDDE